MIVFFDPNNHYIKNARMVVCVCSRKAEYQVPKCLCFQRKFAERVQEILPKMEIITKASRCLSSSKRFRKILELVLASGNFMNCGKRSKEACAFRLSALRTVVETKSVQRFDYTLLHYIVEIVTRDSPEILRLKRELAPILDAAKFNVDELQSDVKLIQTGVGVIEGEIRHYESDTSNPNFVAIFKQFVETAKPELLKLQSHVREMKYTAEVCLKRFGEDPTVSTVDECFGHVSHFVCAFSLANRQLEAAKEAEEQRKRTMELTLTRRKKNQAKQQARTKADAKYGDFDQLISALQSGELFSEELNRLRKSFRGSIRKTEKKRTRKNIETGRER